MKPAPAVRPVSHRRRNLLSIGVAFLTVGVLYANYEPAPAGGSIEERVKLDKLGEKIAMPTDDAKGGAQAKNTLHGRTAMLMNTMLLEQAIQKLEKSKGYTATFYKQEVVHGNMTKPQAMQVKIRHQPFSVYMKWVAGDKGRELLYVDGKHDNDMLIHLGKGGRVLPTLKLNPNGDQAMKEARYPVTDMGILNLAKKIVAYRKRDLGNKKLPKCVMFDNQILNDRKCYCFVIEYESQADSKDYRKSILFVDKQHLLPVCIQNFAWGGESQSVAERDKATLIEDYRYSGLRLNNRLADSDFDRTNKSYRLQ